MALESALIERVTELSHQVGETVISDRRDFHRFAEVGWTEFRTASLVARRLVDLDYDVQFGPPVVEAGARMGLPSEDVLDAHWHRAVEQGGDPEFLEAMRGGFTGVTGSLSNGSGPTVAIRFDMDALEISESKSPSHMPAQKGFASQNQGAMHACGHDAHTAVGLGVGQVLAELKDAFRGTIKLVFQPAEEGVRGAKAMVAAGVVDDVDFMLAHHLYTRWRSGELTCAAGGYFATTKFDALFTGMPAHAGASPQAGKNALLAAATAVLNLYAIPRHKSGPTRINVGRLNAGTGRNVICPSAHLAVETRGTTSELNTYMYEAAMRVLYASAAMYDCQLEIIPMGSAESAESNPELADRVAAVATEIGGFALRPPEASGGSEDYTYMMRRVQEKGGLATHIGIGAGNGGGGHHTPEFDIDEGVLKEAVRLLASVALDLLPADDGDPE